MGSSQFEIVARLQLRAEQFSSEGGRSFAEMATRAKTTAAGIRQDFSQTYAEVQKLAAQSMKMPRTATGSLDLSGEIASLRQSAAAADQKAAVARELSAAMLAASSSSRTVTEAMRLEADAAMVAARGEEADATAIRQRILALEAVQVQLNKTTTATIGHSRAANDNVVSAEQQRQAMMMAGQQAQDFAVQVANGGSVATAFSQQIGQLAFAAQNMGGKLAGVAAFLTSGWGIFATITAVVLTPFVAKILEGNDALEEETKSLKENAEKAAIADRAKAAFAMTEAGLLDDVRQLTDEIKKQNDALLTNAERLNIRSKQDLEKAGIRRERVQTQLITARENLANIEQNAPDRKGDTGYAARLGAARAEVRGLETRLQELVGAINKANDARLSSLRTMADEAAKRAIDPLERIKRTYEGPGGLIEQAEKHATREEALNGTLTRRLTILRQQMKIETDEERKRQSDAKRKPTRDADTATPSSVIKLLRDGLGAVTITATTNGKHVAGSDHYRGAAIDFVPKGGMGSITKDQIRDVFEKAGVSIRRGKGGTEQLFGPGDKGHSDHFHVAWEKGKLALDNYRASVREASKEEREAAKEQKALDTALDQILDKFDPAADAARKYREELEQIAKLAQAGKITPDQEVLYIRGAKKDYTQAQVAASDQMLRDTFGDAQVTAVLQQFDDGVAAGVEVLKAGAEDAAITFGDGLRAAVGDAMDLLGVRINGPLGGQLRNLLQPGGIEGQAKEVATSLTDALKNSPFKISPESIEKISGTIGSVVAGASYGQIGGSVFSSITGGKQNQLGSSLGGVAGKVAGDALGKTIASTIGGTLGKTLGSAAGPLGAIAGGIVGSVIGGLFQKTKQASSTLTFGSDGLAAGTAKGNGTAEKAAASASANSVVGSLSRIAEALGGSVTGGGSVSIGYRPGHKDGAYRVDTTGQGRLTGVLAFATEEEAVRAAIADALSDGVISGISAASKRILAAGGDLEKALSKALMIEAVPKDLKAMLDPVGAAIDELNAKFQKTVDALKEGGATAEQMTQAQRLYDLQLAQVRSSTASASQGLKDFLLNLKIGSTSPYSLRDQEATARAALQPYLDQIAAGQTIDQGKYQSAASAYLDIERQIYGSTQAYFDVLDAVQASTNKAIATIDNAVPIGTPVAAPFAKETAASAAATAEGVQTGNEMTQDVISLLARMTAALEANGNSAPAGDFIGAGRGFQLQTTA
jgi:hypothetical protein